MWLMTTQLRSSLVTSVIVLLQSSRNHGKGFRGPKSAAFSIPFGRSSACFFHGGEVALVTSGFYYVLLAASSSNVKSSTTS